MQLGDKIPKFTKNGTIELGSVYFGCKKYSKNILYHDECLGWPENLVKWKIFSVDCKISALKM